MRRMLSKENFVDLAQQAAGALRRIVSSSDARNSRDALSATSQAVVQACKAKHHLDVSAIETWVDELVQEVELQMATFAVAGVTDSALKAASGSSINAEDASPSFPVASTTSTATDAASPTATGEKSRPEGWKPLSEASILTNLEVARKLLDTVNASDAMRIYHDRSLVPALVRYYSHPALSPKLRDECAMAVMAVAPAHRTLLLDCFYACGSIVQESATDYGARLGRVLTGTLLVEVLHQYHADSRRRSDSVIRTAEAEAEAEDHRRVECSKILLDSLFRSACQLLEDGGGAVVNGLIAVPSPRADPAEGAPGETTEGQPFIASSGGASPLAANAADASLSMNSEQASPNAAVAHSHANDLLLTSTVVYLAVMGGLYRGDAALKAYVLTRYSADYTQLWAAVAARLSQMRTKLSLPSTRATVPVVLESVAYWRLELFEALMELCTASSFTKARETATLSFSGASSGMAAPTAITGSPVATRNAVRRSGGSASSPLALPTHAASAGFIPYEPMAVDWEACLASGTTVVWQLASALYSCPVTTDGAEVLQAVLLRLETKFAAAETLYRWLIATLTLVCAANPKNAFLLSEHGMLRTLIALVNCNQPSVFSASEEVTLWSCLAREAESPALLLTSITTGQAGEAAQLTWLEDPRLVTLTLAPSHTLSVTTTQLTFGFLDTLASTTFSKNGVSLLLKGIKDMYVKPSSQTDVDVVENVLGGLSRSFIPRPLLFFPGDGYVTWRLKHIFARGSGCAVSAWINPSCVWGSGGSCLYSFMDQADTRVSVLLVADGKLCSIAVRVNKAGGEPAEFVLGDSNFFAGAWTHVVVNHGGALNVFVNGRHLETVQNVPYPRERHALTFTMGGAAQLPGFFGYAAALNLSQALPEQEVARLYAAGPALYEPTKDCSSFLVSCVEEEGGSAATGSGGISAPRSSRSGGSSMTGSGSATPTASLSSITPTPVSSLQQHEVLAKRSSEFSWHRVELFTPTTIEELVEPKRVAEWVLSVLQTRTTARIQSPSTFMNIAKLCMSLLSTSMQLASSEQLTTLVRKHYMDRLRAELLSWPTTFPELASLLLQSVTVRGSARVLRQHACSQCVFDLLLGCVLQTGERNREALNGEQEGSMDAGEDKSEKEGGDGPLSSPRTETGLSTPIPFRQFRSAAAQATNATNIILRELSDCLTVKSNVDLFQEDATRFQHILNLSLYLPKECIKSIVILIEKLCRNEADLRRIFFFLFTPSTASPTADTAKVRVLRMLFDIAQEDVLMCEMIQECFKGSGFAFVLMLVNGENHASEAIRVIAIGLLSLLMSLKSCAKYFKKNDGFDMLALAITEPRQPIPLGIRTFDALIQVAFNEFKPRREKKSSEGDSIAMRLMAATHLTHRPKQRDSSASTSSVAAVATGGGSAGTPTSLSTAVALPGTGATGSGGDTVPTTTAAVSVPCAGSSAASPIQVLRRTMQYCGHTPPVTVSQVGTRRGYSFEHTHDYGKVDEDFGELVVLHKGRRYHSLELPLALKTVLCALDYLIQGLVNYSPSSSSSSTPPVVTRAWSTDHFLSTPATASVGAGGDHFLSPSHRLEGSLMPMGLPSTMDDERVVVEVLNYLSKVIDYQKHAIKLMDIQWLGGLWVAVRVFFEKPVDLNSSPTRAAEGRRTSSALSSDFTGRDAVDQDVRRLHIERTEFVSEVTQRTRTIIRKMIVRDISTNERAQVRAIRDGTSYPSRLVRIVLEEIARHFASPKNAELVDNASNVIRNLNYLFRDVQIALQPFPPSLGIAIVVAITNISVSSSTQVRQRMKNSSSLLTTRDQLAFFVLRESRRFLRLRTRSLHQVIDMNANNTHAMTVLLYHLANAVTENNVSEVELLVPLVPQLASSDPARARELHEALRDMPAVCPLEELLLSGGNASRGSALSPLLPSANSSRGFLSESAMNDVFTDVDSNHGGHRGSAAAHGMNPLEDADEVTPSVVTGELLDWCHSNKEIWAGVQRNIEEVVTSLPVDRRSERKNDRGSRVVGGGGGEVDEGDNRAAKTTVGGAAGVGYSERSRRGFEQLRTEVREELAKATEGMAARGTLAASATASSANTSMPSTVANRSLQEGVAS